MQSPPAELGADIVRLALVNLVRARGEADGDTLSEVTRAWVARTRHGRPVLYAGTLAVAAIWIQHIDRPLRRP